jgi:hypothetical protein
MNLAPLGVEEVESGQSIGDVLNGKRGEDQPKNAGHDVDASLPEQSAKSSRDAEEQVRDEEHHCCRADNEGEKRWHTASFAAQDQDARKAPGPAMSGIASGKTEISSLARASASSSTVSRLNWAKTMSTAIRNRRIPPAIRSAPKLIPR